MPPFAAPHGDQKRPGRLFEADPAWSTLSRTSPRASRRTGLWAAGDHPDGRQAWAAVYG
jgi:hypothetical protein